MILKKDTNELLKLILEERHDINKFKLNKLNSSAGGQIVSIKYDNSPMEFWLYPGSKENFDVFKVTFIQFGPSLPTTEESLIINLEKVKEIFRVWLNTHLKNYLENENDIDYWKIIGENPLSIENIDFSENEPFKIEEREQLKLGIEEIKILISNNFDLKQSEIDLTHKKLDYLIDATNRLNKTDWKSIAISTICTIAYDLSFDEHKRNIFFGLFSKLWAVIQHLPSIII